MAAFLNYLLMMTLLALTQFQTLNAEDKRMPSSKNSIKPVGGGISSQNLPESDMKRKWGDFQAWGKRWAEQKKWDDFSAWGKRWGELSAWGKRNGLDKQALSDELLNELRQASVGRNLGMWPGYGVSDSNSEANEKRAWDSFTSWGKRNLGNRDRIATRSWDDMSAWGKRDGDVGEKRSWDSFNSWGKRSSLKNRINARSWDSLQAWGKRDSMGADNSEGIGSLGKREWDAMNSWGKRSSGKNPQARR